jgi:hypothetical protein
MRRLICAFSSLEICGCNLLESLEILCFEKKGRIAQRFQFFRCRIFKGGEQPTDPLRMFQTDVVMVLIGENQEALARFDPKDIAIQNDTAGFTKTGHEDKPVVQKGCAPLSR